jgi:hypothetical protein
MCGGGAEVEPVKVRWLIARSGTSRQDDRHQLESRFYLTRPSAAVIDGWDQGRPCVGDDAFEPSGHTHQP